MPIETPDLTIRRDSPLHDFWFGYLAVENAAEVHQHLVSMLTGKKYAFASSHEGHLGLSDLRVDQVLDGEQKLIVEDERAHLLMHDRNYTWGLHSSFATQRAAQEHVHAGGHSAVFISFSYDYRGQRVVIEQYNGRGERLHWIVVVQESEDGEL